MRHSASVFAFLAVNILICAPLACGDAYYDFGDGTSATQTQIGNTTYYNGSDGSSGTGMKIGDTTFYNFQPGRNTRNSYQQQQNGGGFAGGFAQGFGESFSKAMEQQRQNDFVAEQNNKRLALEQERINAENAQTQALNESHGVKGKQANALLSEIKGEPVTVFQDDEQVSEYVLDKMVSLYKSQPETSRSVPTPSIDNTPRWLTGEQANDLLTSMEGKPVKIFKRKERVNEDKLNLMVAVIEKKKQLAGDAAQVEAPKVAEAEAESAPQIVPASSPSPLPVPSTEEGLLPLPTLTK